MIICPFVTMIYLQITQNVHGPSPSCSHFLSPSYLLQSTSLVSYSPTNLNLHPPLEHLTHLLHQSTITPPSIPLGPLRTNEDRAQTIRSSKPNTSIPELQARPLLTGLLENLLDAMPPFFDGLEISVVLEVR
jgi:hypothetical protein